MSASLRRILRPVVHRSGVLGLLRFLRTGMAYARICEPREFRVLSTRCTLCDFPRLLRLHSRDGGVRCLRCMGGLTHMSLAYTLGKEWPDLAEAEVYEMSSAGPLFRYLERNSRRITGSEYWPDVEPGQWREGFQCQNVEKLTYADNCFHVITSTEVFEHVADDRAGFREALRVLKPGGRLVFSVPLRLRQKTLERARIVDGRIEHLEEPEYHHDAIRGRNTVLAFRTYGYDIVDRLREAGFQEACIDETPLQVFDGRGRAIVVGRA